MSVHERRSRGPRVSRSPITLPPRVALSGRPARADQSDGQSSDGAADATSETEAATSSREQGEHGGSDGDSKNARIVALEKDIAVMEEEFSNELEQLGQKLTTESEIKAYWQQKHSALNQQFLKTDADLRVLRHEVASRDKQRDDWDRDAKALMSLMTGRDGLKDAYHAAKVELARREEEIQQLRAQVKALKDFVSTNSRTDGQVTDEVFGELMQKLGNGLQNWVILNFRRARIDVAKIKGETRKQLLYLVPTYESQATSKTKIHLIISLISRVLVTSVFETYFVGLPEDQSKELQKVEQYLKSITGDVGSVNQWRSTTLAILRKGAVDKLRSTTDAVIDSIVERINSIMDDISDAKGSEARDQSLKALINSSIDLSRLVRVQKAVFKMVMPVIEGHHISTFDAETMEDVGGEDEDEGSKIYCVTFPGMIKEGDESGEHAQFRNVIAKARVLCSPD